VRLFNALVWVEALNSVLTNLAKKTARLGDACCIYCIDFIDKSPKNALSM